MIYLDNAATTFPKPDAVYSAMDTANRNLAFNAGRGAYHAARDASKVIDDAKRGIAELLGVSDDGDIIFTPSVTHAMNQVIFGLELNPDSSIYLSPYEHNAVARTAQSVARRTGATIRLIPTKSDLSIDLDKLAYMFSINRPDVVIINALSNVTGYILPTKEIFCAAKSAGAITVLDAAQAAGLIPIDMKHLRADIVCFAGHKTLMGPFGIGGFAIRHGCILKKTLTGGTGSDSLNLEMPENSPGRYEAASANVPAIAGLLAAVKELNVSEHEARIRHLTSYMVSRLQEIDGLHILGLIDNANLGIISFVVDGYQSDEIGVILDEEFDIAVRTGYHCAPFIHDLLNDRAYTGTVRASVGLYTTEEEIDSLVDALSSL